MNWQPLISRWRVEADRREAQLHASRGTGDAYHRAGESMAIETLRKCAEQAEKSLKRQKLRERKARRVPGLGDAVVRVTKASDPNEPSKW